MSRVYAVKGDTVTCEKEGHHICTVVRDLWAGNALDKDDFTNWHADAEPKDGCIVNAMCPACWPSSSWVKSTAFNQVVLFVNGEWRPRNR